MIDHVSIAVRDLAAATRFYAAVLAPLGYAKLHVLPKSIGFARHGKGYVEFWLNHRPAMQPLAAGTGVHVCLRALSTEIVDAFYAAALKAGDSDDGAPGKRPEYSATYYAAFIRDPDGNRIEAVTFLAKG